MNRRKPTELPPVAAARRPPDYLSLVREANSFNSRLVAGRTGRLPFIDTQTGVAQANCCLWRSERERTHCQAKSSSSTGRGLLYSYPSQRWLKKNQLRRFALDQLESRPADCAHWKGGGPAGELVRSSSVPSSACSVSSVTGESSTGASREFVAMIAITRQQQSHHAAPSRADSTGSHSFADSDSRDHSSGASQSIGSPKSQLLDDDQQQQFALVSRHEELHAHHQPDRAYAAKDADDEAARFIGRVKQRPHGRGRRPGKNKMGAFRRGKTSLLADTVGEIARGLAPASKNNGRKTTQNNNQDRQVKTTTTHRRAAAAAGLRARPAPRSAKRPLLVEMPDDETKAALRLLRPYVCPICDQSYKTRPGLSYHFIHSHDTVLPRSLPVKIGGHNPRAGEAPTGGADSRKRRRQLEPRDSTGSTESSRVLRHCRRARAVAATVNGSSQSSQNGDEGLGCNSEHVAEKIGQPRADPQAADEQDSDLDCADCQPAAAAESEKSAPEPQEELQEKTRPTSDDDNVPDNQDRPADETSEFEAGTQSSGDAVGELAPGSLGDERAPDNPNNGLDHEEHPPAEKLSQPEAALKAGACKQNLFCDFCLGTADKNRRTRLPEELISCSSCGSSGHPSCLRFSENIRRSVRRYNWQCIECKTCSTCNQADHEDQLLFCDDCDRSYHTYCLSPRLEQPPEGNWTCKPCLAEYYTPV